MRIGRGVWESHVAVRRKSTLRVVTDTVYGRIAPGVSDSVFSLTAGAISSLDTSKSNSPRIDARGGE